MILKKVFFIFCLCTAFCACVRKDQSAEKAFFKGRDSYNREVVIQHEPLRVVSFSQAVTEIMYLLHAENKLVGVSQYCTYPLETQNIAKVGDLQNINVESVMRLRPDLIIVGSVVSKPTVQKFEKAAVPVYCLKEEQHLSDLPKMVRTMGNLLDKSGEADALALDFEKKLSAYKSNADTTRASVYYVVGFGEAGDFTAGGNTFIHDIITLAGGRNIGEDLATWSISREYLFQQDPDCIFIRKEDCESFCNTYPYTLLSAVKNKKVYPIESGWIDILSPRNFDAVDYIRSTISQ